MIELIVDCDTGIDDALALMWLAGRTDVHIVAVGSVHGNIDAETSALNSLKILEICGGVEVPVAIGARRPLVAPLHLATYVHGEDGLGNAGLERPARKPEPISAIEQLVSLARSRPGELQLLATGPLTNLALALAIEPRLPQLLQRVVVMGGAVGVPGNITPLAEANFYHDPEAAAAVLDAGFNLVMVGLDVTSKVFLDASHLAELSASSPKGQLAARILPHYMDFYAPILNRRACLLHDPLAAALVVERDLAQYEQLRVKVELGGEWTRGASLVDRRGGIQPGELRTVSVATDVDSERFLQLFLDGILAKAE